MFALGFECEFSWSRLVCRWSKLEGGWVFKGEVFFCGSELSNKADN